MRELEDCFLYIVWQLNRKEPISRIEVVLTFLVDKADPIAQPRTDLP
ncbi:MAG: hypothetical protein JWN02_314, partial [Acidobacteria bacterium]|nr:hypothetical protein [Acidobacteriota bacterium]